MIRLDWQPQRVVNIALIASALAGLLCLVIIIRTAKPRFVGAASLPTNVSGDVSWFDRHSVQTVWNPATLWGTVITMGCLAALFVRPWVGLVIAGATWCAMRSKTGRWVVRFSSPIMISGIAIFMAISQLVEHYGTGTDWPGAFHYATYPTWIALFLLLVEAVVGWNESRSASEATTISSDL